jgi:hypothetical protein
MKDVTGRDGYLICKALAYAIEAIHALPRKWQEEGDAEDMRLLLEAMAPDDAELQLYIQNAHRHLTQGKP